MNARFLYPLTGFIILYGTLFSQRPQSIEALNQEVNDLTRKIKALQKRQKEEQDFYNTYKKEMEAIIERKENEEKSLTQKILTLQKNIAAEKTRAQRFKNQTQAFEQRFAIYTRTIADAVKRYKTAIQSGIPFEKNKRESTLSALMIDIEARRGNCEEYFNRYLDFLKSEEAMAYDSEVINTLYPIDKTTTEVQMLRLGRVFFCVIHKNEIYLFTRSSQGWGINKALKLSLARKKSIHNTVKILLGNRPPELVAIPVPAELIGSAK